MSRAPLIVANWKMHKTSEETRQFIYALNEEIGSTQKRVFIAPSFTSIPAAIQSVKGTKMQIGAQTMHDQLEGAFTGEVSAPMLKELGASFVILGHSERREYAGETDLSINRKLHLALYQELQPIVCIGESLKEREHRQYKFVLKQQLHQCLQRITERQASQLILSYEPVWAIGTGKTATPEIAQEAHSLIRSYLEEMFSLECAQKVCLLYGGSVKPENVSSLMTQTDIDGVLVGSASLDLRSFINIINF